MQYTHLGRTGLQVSRLCLGTMTYGTPTVAPVGAGRRDKPALHSARPRARDQLLRHRRHVLARRLSEEVLGRALRDFARREEVVIATKVFFPMGDGPNERGLSRCTFSTPSTTSLRRLGTDYVDLYQIHRWDPETPIEETLEALARCGEGRQGALHRRLQHVRLAVRQGPLPGRPARLDALRLDAEPLQPGLPGGGAGDDPPVPGPRASA